MFRFLLLLGIFSLWMSCKDKKEPSMKGNSGKDTPALKLEGYVAQKSVSEKDLKLNGTVLSSEEVEIKSEVAGRLLKIHFIEGGFVQKGQILATLDDREIDAEINKLKIERNLLQIKEQRQKQLLTAEAGTRADYDLALNALQTLDAQIKLLEVRKSKYILTAPFGGIAGFRQVSEGAYINSGTVLASIYSISPLEIEFSVPEKYAALMKTGNSIKFSQEGSDQQITASIHLIEPFIDPVNRTLRCRAQFNNGSRIVKPGAYVRIDLNLGRNQKTIVVPAKAIIPDLKGAKVYVTEGGKGVFRPVKLGFRSENFVEVTEGLQEGDTIITNGLLQLKPGNPVSITSFFEADKTAN